MHVLYVCKALDADHPLLATQCTWVEALAARVDRVTVVTPRLGRFLAPPNVVVHPLRHRDWVRRTAALWRTAARQPRFDAALVAQGGPWPALLLPVKLALRRPVYQWKAMPHVSWRMRFYASVCDDLVFTATPSSFAHGDRVVVTGHGVDVAAFAVGANTNGAPLRDVLAVGRVAPIKGFATAIEAAAAAGRALGRRVGLDIAGPVAPAAAHHRAQLEALATHLGEDVDVRFLGPVQPPALPALLRGYRATINCSSTALDKAVVESMAARVPVVSTNVCVAEILPADLGATLTAPPGDASGAGTRLANVLALPEAKRAALGASLHDIAARDHSVEHLFDTIVARLAPTR